MLRGGAGAVEIGSLLAVVSVTHASQVHVMFRARLLAPRIRPGPESLEVGLYAEAEIPWDDSRFRAANSRCASTSPTAPPGARIIISRN